MRGAGGHGSQVGEPDGAAFLPGAAGKVGPAGEGEAHAFLNEDFGAAPGSSPGGAEFQTFFLGVDSPFDGHVPALGDAKSLEDAHGGDIRGRIFADDLADHQLQGQAVFALLLLGDIAEQAANGERIAGLLPLAEAQFQFQDAAIGGVMAQRCPVHHLAIEGAAKERGHFGAAAVAEELFKGIEFEQFGISWPKQRFQAGLA